MIKLTQVDRDYNKPFTSGSRNPIMNQPGFNGRFDTTKCHIGWILRDEAFASLPVLENETESHLVKQRVKFSAYVLVKRWTSTTGKKWKF